MRTSTVEALVWVLVYGGGAFGAGHEARIPVSGIEEAQTVLEKLRRVAAACR